MEKLKERKHFFFAGLVMGTSMGLFFKYAPDYVFDSDWKALGVGIIFISIFMYVFNKLNSRFAKTQG